MIDPGKMDSTARLGSPVAGSPPTGETLRRAYSDRAIAQIPRLLSLQDRNEFSRTYGCFNREYWLCRTVDFPSSIAQFGMQSLALAYIHPFPDNPYRGSPKILLYALAAMDYLTRIQRPDGSFDEFYPNERGWAGPTGFLVYAMCDSRRLLDGHIPRDLDEKLRVCIARAARFLAEHDEPGVLANHHAMAVLPVYEAYRILGEKRLLTGFHARLDDFLRACHEEGWCLEYDGADIGYLSATVSFLGKLRKLYTDERIEQVIGRAIEFCSYFTFPDGHYGGSLGSRQTLHFYPHGFELAAPENPTAAAVAEAMLRALWAGRLVPPEIQEDRYFLYRIPELLQSWVDWSPRPANLPLLPCEGPPFERTWPAAKIHVRRTENAYLAVNLAKGGVLQVARTDGAPRLVISDCGILAETADGRVLTSQWIDPDLRIDFARGSGSNEGRPPGREAGAGRGDDPPPGSDPPVSLEVSGALHYVVMKVFTPPKMIAFRLFLLIFGWNTAIAYRTKGWIRQLLMTRSGAAPARFRRTLRFANESVTVTDRIERGGGPAFRRVKIGDDFSVRYVPQSRYFQQFELGVSGSYLTEADITRLNREGVIEVTRVLDFKKGLVGYGIGEGE